MEAIAEQMRIQHNEYGGEQIDRRSYDVNRSMIFNRESLRQSMIMKERLSKASDSQSQLKTIVERLENGPDQLEIAIDDNHLHGVLDGNYFIKEERKRLSREYSGQAIRNITFDLFEGYTNDSAKDSDTQMILQLIKANMKVTIQKKGLKTFQKLK